MNPLVKRDIPGATWDNGSAPKGAAPAGNRGLTTSSDLTGKAAGSMIATPPDSCSMPDCDRPVKRRGLCYGHYMKSWRYGDPAWTPPRRRRNLLGERFGLLLVIGELDPKHWLCRCDCGNESRVRGWSLTSGGTTTCNGPEAGHWRADYVDYSAAHQRVRRDKGSASNHRCVDCSATAAHWSYDHSDPQECHTDRGYAFSLSSDHYEARCVPCHKAFDMGRADAADVDADG